MDKVTVEGNVLSEDVFESLIRASALRESSTQAIIDFDDVAPTKYQGLIGQVPRPSRNQSNLESKPRNG